MTKSSEKELGKTQGLEEATGLFYNNLLFLFKL